MRSYSIRNLCREAADPTTPTKRLAVFVDGAGRFFGSYRVRLRAALLSNPALPLADAVRLIKMAPKRRPYSRWDCYMGHFDERMAVPICRAIESNSAWTLYRITDSRLDQLDQDVATRLAHLWPEVWEAWYGKPGDDSPGDDSPF